MLPCPVHAHGNFGHEIVIGHVIRAVPFLSATHIPYSLCKAAPDRNWSRRPCRRQIQTTAFAVRRRNHRRGDDGRCLHFWRFDNFGSFNFRRLDLRRFDFWLLRFLGFFRRLFLDHLTAIFSVFPEQTFARRKIKQHQHQDGVEGERNHQVHFRRVLRFCVVGIAAAFYLVNGSVAKSTFGTFACWQTSSTARICLYFVLRVAAHDDVQIGIVRRAGR